MDYLVEEVLQRQPEHVRSFLLQTSILDRLSGPLCDAVTNREDGKEVLEALERGNLFIVPLDDKRQWYRYHHLFADVLQAHSMEESSQQVPVRHRGRASGTTTTGCGLTPSATLSPPRTSNERRSGRAGSKRHARRSPGAHAG